MSAYVPSPDALPLPAPVWLFTALLHLTFLLHLLAMNALLGGGVLMLAARLRGGEDRAWLVARLAKLLPSLFAATVTLGVAPLLFMQVLYGQFFYTSSILMGWPWFLSIVVLILAYYGFYLNSFRGERLGGARTLVILAAVVLVAWVGFLMTNNTTLMLTPDRWPGFYFADPSGNHLNTGEPLVWPRYLHMLLGAVAVAGLWLAWLGRREDDRAHGTWLVRHGLSVFAVLTALNLPVGWWEVSALRPGVRGLLLGGSGHLTGLTALGTLLGLGLAAWAWRHRTGDGTGVMPLFWATVAEMVLMILLRHGIRDAYLGDLYRPAAMGVQSQWLNMTIFAVFLVGCVAASVWMVVRLLAAQRR